MIGYFERMFGLNAEGWASDEQADSNRLKLFAVDSTGRIVGSGETHLQRPDVYQATGGGLGSGFSIKITEKCSPGRIRILNDNGTELSSSEDVLAPQFFSREKYKSYLHTRSTRILGLVVFIFAPTDWEIRFQRPQHLAVYLSNIGYQVFYVQPRLGYTESEADIITTKVSKNLSLIRACVNKPAATTLDLEKDLLGLLSDKIISVCPYGSKIVEIIQHPLWHGILSAGIEKKISIFDFLDDVAGVKGEHGLRALPHQNELIKRSDFVVTTSDALRQIALRERNEVLFAPNGASKIFSSVVCRPRSSSDTAIYIGAIEEWFDFDLVNVMMRINFNMKLILVGSCSCKYKSIFQYIDRLEFLGEVDHFALPQIMTKARVGIIPFKNTSFSKTIDAVKKYEYILAGLPVVASGLVVDETLGDYFKVENNPNEFSKAVREAMSKNFLFRMKGKMRARSKIWHKQLDGYRKILSSL